MSELTSIEEQIYQRVEEDPNKIAVIHKKRRITYKALWIHILEAAKIYKDVLKLHPGDAVVLAADKNIEFLYAYFGGHLAGLHISPIAADTNTDRLQYILTKLKARLLVGFRGYTGEVSTCSWDEFDVDTLDDDAQSIDFPILNSIADILFTTGTTGEPKGVPLTFKNVAAAARNINTFIGNTKSDVEVLALPIAHSFGLGRIRCCLSVGATICLVGSFANIKKLFRTIEEEKATVFTMVPASWRYLKKYTGNRLSEYKDQLKFIEMGSAFFGADEKRELAALLPNTRVCMHYGLTEASRSAFMEFHDDDQHLDSVGKHSPYTEIEIFDENGNKLPANTEGEICVKGEHVMNGYLYHDNANTYFDGYFRTGDWGTKDVNGYIYLKSRKKELINVGGKKVSPVEVELELKKIPEIKDCACVAIPDPNQVLGEVVKAFLVKSDTESNISFADITKILSGRLEGYKIPAVYEWIDEIPKTYNGKIQRLSLK